MRKCKSLDDILIIPAMSDISKRSDIDISCEIEDRQIDIPIIASCMDTICEEDMAVAMWECGSIGVVHRYNTPKEQCKILQNINANISARTVNVQGPPLAAAIGVKNIEPRLDMIHRYIDWVFVDVAHGHHSMVIDTIQYIKDKYPRLIIVAGNVATRTGAKDLFDAGAHGVRVGIGSGGACSTRSVTGIGVPQATAIEDVYEAIKTFKWKRFAIADGGIKNSGDIAKSIALGANLVMIGSLFAGTKESPGRIHEFGTNHKCKVFHGMASKDAQVHHGIKLPNDVIPEGISSIVPYAGSIKNVIKQLVGGLKSSMSYVGATNLMEFRKRVKFIEITDSGYREGQPHGIHGQERERSY